MTDALPLAQALIRRPSVTPADAGAIAVLEAALAPLGFACRRMAFGGIENLYARRGVGRPHLCFAGHTDVVPPGEAAAWSRDPFSGEIATGMLHGRGAADMKGAIAAFVAAVAGFAAERQGTGSISLLITGDEEGLAEHGTKAVIAALAAENEAIDHCIVGEPASRARLGDMLKIGRRGSLNAEVVALGVQGHVAYPERGANPIPPLVRFLAAVQERRLDDGAVGFQPSNLEVTSIDVGNPATNVIPAKALAKLNIRFNPRHAGAELASWLEEEARRAAERFVGRLAVSATVSGEAFLTAPGPFTDLIAGCVQAETALRPELSTSGGTSDARFIRALCPVVELGLVGETMHAIDEQVAVADIEALARIYARILAAYFAAEPAELAG